IAGILGLKKPVPMTKQAKPIKNMMEESKAIEACPRVMMAAPMITAALDPIYLSAMTPPKIGVIYSNIAYVPYNAPACSAVQPQPGFCPKTEAVRNCI